jgi:NAD(P)-dependent dehydrogenase (short-subunit alcohol dehydrogenase family)
MTMSEGTKDLHGKVALVTGASSGIGRATALAFARAGAAVVVASRNLERLEETARVIRETGGEATAIRTDVTRADQVERLVQETVDVYGRLDAAFNNAGGYRLVGGKRGLTADLGEDVWDRVTAVNLKGVWLCMKYEIEQMLAQGGGAIVNNSSNDGLRAVPYSSPYVAAKHGVIGLTKTAAMEYARQGIRVNAVCPGWILTPPVRMLMEDDPGVESAMLAEEPIGRFGEPEEVAEAVLWLCSEAASYVTGHALAVDGGYLA